MKKGFLEISFGMIFSIILIIVFLAFAFFGIKKLLDVQETATIAKFKSDLQNDVDKMWTGPLGSVDKTYKLPRKIDGVCFEEDALENLYFLPAGKLKGDLIEHSVIPEKFCLQNSDGEFEIVLKKDFGETLVSILKND